MAEIPGFFAGTGMPDPGWWEALLRDPKEVLTKTGLKAGADVIDLCSGDGWFALPISKIARHVFAIDIDPKLISAARVRLSENEVTNCTFIESDAYEISKVVSEPVDYVFLANAFHGVPYKRRLAHEIHAALKPNGLLAVVNWYAQPREETVVLGMSRGPATELRMTPEATIANVEGGGFRTLGIEKVSPYHYAAIFQRI